MAKLTGYSRVAEIKIASNKYYFALYDENIQIGDTVMVSGVYKDICNISNIIQVADIKNYYKGSITQEVICKVVADKSAYEKRVEIRKKAENLKKKMDEEVKKMQEESKYDVFAEKNPVLAEMLAEYKRLTE